MCSHVHIHAYHCARALKHVRREAGNFRITAAFSYLPPVLLSLTAGTPAPGLTTELPNAALKTPVRAALLHAPPNSTLVQPHTACGVLGQQGKVIVWGRPGGVLVRVGTPHGEPAVARV